MNIKTALACALAFILMLSGMSKASYAQEKRVSIPRINITTFKIEATLIPETHEIKAVAAYSFSPIEATDVVMFEVGENLSIQKVLNSEGIELNFSQNEGGTGRLAVRFDKPLEPASKVTIKIEYQGGFDRDRFSRMFARDEGSSYIGMEGSYLMYSAKWAPVNRFFSDRASGTVEVTVPLGMTAIGPGIQLPVITKGISETFRWEAKSPILPASIIVGQYSSKKIRQGDFSIDLFARDKNLDQMQKFADAAAKIWDFYSKAYGAPAAGKSFRLVEVDDRLEKQSGMLGTVFVTHNELSQANVPVRELARRIAFQWWQETMGVASSSDLWLIDGMAYFSAAEYIQKTQGEEAYKKELENLAVLALKFETKSAARAGLSLGYKSDVYESVVAGKGAWILIMLKGMLGDSKFDQLIHQYLHAATETGGGAESFQKMAEKQYGKELGWFFNEWLENTGIPEMQVDYAVFKTSSGFRVSGTLKQDKDLFRMPVDVAVVADDKKEIKTINLNGKSSSFDINTYTFPEKVVLDPNHKILLESKELRTSVQLALGNDLKQKGNFVESIRAFEAALKLDPHRSVAHFRLGEVFYEQFNLQSAANSFRDALNGDKEPKWIETWCYIYLGKIYDMLGNRQRAMAEYTKAINTKNDEMGAQAEASKWMNVPFTKERTHLDSEETKP